MTNTRQKQETAGELTWKTSYWLVAFLAVSIGAFAILSSLGIDWMIHGVLRATLASDWFEAAGAASFSGLALTRLQARRRELLVRMQIVEDVNHHVRNALTSIVLSASLRHDEDLNAQVRDACDRIDWVLNDVLSQSVDATALRAEHPAWSAGRQLGQPNPSSHSAQTKNMRN